MAEPTLGYNGRSFKILFDGEVIAAVQSREVKRNKEAVDVTTDDSDGWQRVLSEPGVRSVDVTIEGVATIDNYNNLIDRWNGSSLQNVTLQHPNGTEETADDGFFLGNLTMGAEHDKHVSFSAELKSSGPVRAVYSGSTT